MPNQRRGVFESNAWPAVLLARYEAQAADLERTVVKQALELEFLKKALQSGPPQSRREDVFNHRLARRVSPKDAGGRNRAPEPP
jgi:transposase